MSMSKASTSEAEAGAGTSFMDGRILFDGDAEAEGRTDAVATLF